MATNYMIVKVEDSGGGSDRIASTFYCTCTTAAGTAQKAATVADSCTFTDNYLITGVTVHVKFTNSNTHATPTLKVGTATAKQIMKYGTTKPGITPETSWQAGSVVSFTYDGTYWMMNDHLDDTNTQTVTGVKGNSETDYRTGNVNLTAANIGAATSGHTHGNIANGGTIASTAVTPASDDYILISDNSSSGTANKIERGIKIGTSTTTFLNESGKWSTPVGTTYTGTSPISINSSTHVVSLGTVPIANGGTAGTTKLEATDSLSALYGLAGGTLLVADQDCDSLTVGKTYYSSGSTLSDDLVNPPTTSSGFKIYTLGTYSTNYPAQIAFLPSGGIMTRGKYKDGSNYPWTAWRTLYHTGNLTSQAAASGGTTNSLVTTGEKYTWNNKVNRSGDTMTGTLTLQGTAGNQRLKVRCICGITSGTSPTQDALYLNYGNTVNDTVYVGNTGGGAISSNGTQYSGNSATASKANLLVYQHSNEINFSGGPKATCHINYRDADTDAAGTDATLAVTYKFENYTNTTAYSTLDAAAFTGVANKSKILCNYFNTANNSTANRPTSANITSLNSGGVRAFVASSVMTTSKPAGDANILHFDWDNGTKYSSQLAILHGTGRLQHRYQTGSGTAESDWTQWYSVYSEAYKPTAADVGLGNVGNFKAVSTVASQGLTSTEKSNARTNIGAGTGTVTKVSTGAGLVGGDIQTTGTIKCALKSETVSTLASASITSTSSRQYAVNLDKNGVLSVNVPWSNSNTYTSAYCSTASDTADKVGTCTNYKLLDKSWLHVTLVNENSVQGAITLNVNSAGAKAIYINGKASSSSNYTLPAGTYLVYYADSKYYFRTDGNLFTPPFGITTYTLTTASPLKWNSGYALASQSGATVQIIIQLLGSGSAATGGTDAYHGTLTGGPLPARDMTLIGYTSSTVIMGWLTTTGDLTARPMTNVTVGSGSGIYLTGTFIGM